MQSRMRALALEALERMDLVLHLHPASDAPAPPLHAARGLTAPLVAPVLPVYTKGDLIAPARRAELKREALVVSADPKTGISALLRGASASEAARRVSSPHDPEDVGTQPLRFFVVEYLREAAFEQLEDELPYSSRPRSRSFAKPNGPSTFE